MALSVAGRLERGRKGSRLPFMLSPPSVSWQHVLEPLEHPWLFPRADRAKHTFEDKGGKLKECQGAIARGLRRRRWKRPEIVRVSGNKSARRTDAHLHKRTHHAPRTRTHAHERAHTHTHIHTHTRRRGYKRDLGGGTLRTSSGI